MNPPVLAPPVAGKPLILYLTVTHNAMGCVLGQTDETNRKEHAIYYLSKKFTECETRYSPLEKTCCALVWTSQRLRQYMLYHTTHLISRMDPLKYIFEKPSLSGKICRWQVQLSEFDIVYTSQKAIKGKIVADHLADQALDEYEPLRFEFPDEDVLTLSDSENTEEEKKKDTWTLYFDGASNLLGQGVGVVLTSPEGKNFPLAARLSFDCTNNVAEYEACAMGVKAALQEKIEKLRIFGDSALVIHQLRGEWETRDAKLIPYQKYIKEMLRCFKEVDLEHVPREQNQMADALATLSSMLKIGEGVSLPPIEIVTNEDPAYCLHVEQEERPWYSDIREFLKNKSYPEGATDNDRRTLRRLSLKFFLDRDVLYKKNHDAVLLRCVDAKEAQQIMKEVHDGICGTHASGHTMARQILRTGYFWLTMETDCIQYARKCHKCQVHADIIHTASERLHVLSSPWPFSMWGLDMIGKIHPSASNRHCFILVAIDYFTKWVEAVSYRSVTGKVIAKFIEKNIICRYGIPERIITDNGTNFNSKVVEDLCKKFKIKHHNSSPYRPQMNGAVEAANKNIKKIIQKMTVTHKDWAELLPFALHGYRTTVRTSTGATPFSLVYGMEAVLPFEVEVPSLRIVMESGIDEAEWVKARHDQLNLIEARRLTAMSRARLYQQRMARAFDKKVHARVFKPGDLVLKRILNAQGDPRGKWAPNYEGPYVVKEAYSGGALMLADMDGNSSFGPVNSDVVKRYYA